KLCGIFYEKLACFCFDEVGVVGSLWNFPSHRPNGDEGRRQWALQSFFVRWFGLLSDRSPCAPGDALDARRGLELPEQWDGLVAGGRNSRGCGCILRVVGVWLEGRHAAGSDVDCVRRCAGCECAGLDLAAPA